MKKSINESERMQELAGIIKEDSHLHISVGLLLHIDESVKNDIVKPQHEVCKTLHRYKDEDVLMMPLPKDKLHVTLTSIRNFKPFKEAFNVPENTKSILDIPAPDVELGVGKFVYRDEKGKITYVLAVKNQGELQEYVNNVYSTLGLENPEPNRFFHITIANNMGGDPFKSIGDVTKEDFK